MTFKDHFSTRADAYASYRPSYPPELFTFLAGLCQQHERAWDCATGNGQAARGLAAYFREVVATDASAQQIAQAPASPGVKFAVATAEASGLEDASVDLLTVAQAAHWFDHAVFHAEAKRVLRPGGVVALWCYERLRVDPAIDAIVEDFYDGLLGPYWPPERRWVESGYRDLPFPFADLPSELRLPEFLIQADWSLEQLLGYFSTWSALKAYHANTGHDPLPELHARLSQHWPDGRRCLTWPISLRLGRISRQGH